MSTSSKVIINKLVNEIGLVEKCVNCDTTQQLTIDHIIPKYHGGANYYANMQIMCRKCNLEKRSTLSDVRILCVSGNDIIDDIFIRNRTNITIRGIKHVIKVCFHTTIYKFRHRVLTEDDYMRFVEYLDVYRIKLETNRSGFCPFESKLRIQPTMNFNFEPRMIAWQL